MSVVLATAVCVTAGVLLLLGGLYAFFSQLLQRMRIEGQRRLAARYRPEQVLRHDLTANFLGLTSEGPLQIRGNGVLVLTSEELWFSRFLSRKDLSVPISKIHAVELTSSHIGKMYIGRQLLCVRFMRGGAEEEAAWLVPNPSAWREAIAGLRCNASG